MFLGFEAISKKCNKIWSKVKLDSTPSIFKLEFWHSYNAKYWSAAFPPVLGPFSFAAWCVCTSSWLSHSNDRFCIWKHLLNHICVTEALNRPQKPPNMVLYQGKFSQPYSQYPVWARVRCGAVYFPLYNIFEWRKKIESWNQDKHCNAMI